MSLCVSPVKLVQPNFKQSRENMQNKKVDRQTHVKHAKYAQKQIVDVFTPVRTL